MSGGATTGRDRPRDSSAAAALLADEPTGALDSETGDAVRRLMRERRDARGRGRAGHARGEARRRLTGRLSASRSVVDQSGVPATDDLLTPAATGGLMRGWRPLLRLAWRRAPRPGTSALVLVLIALPVLAVTTALVVAATGQATWYRGVAVRLGTADALVEFDDAPSRASSTPTRSIGTGAERDAAGRPRTVRRAGHLGTLREQGADRDVRVVEWRRTETLRVETDRALPGGRLLPRPGWIR